MLPPTPPLETLIQMGPESRFVEPPTVADTDAYPEYDPGVVSVVALGRASASAKARYVLS